MVPWGVTNGSNAPGRRASQTRVRRNRKEESFVPSRMGQLTGLWSEQRNSAQNKRSRREGEFLITIVAPVTDMLDGIELPEPPFRHCDGGKTSASSGGNGGQVRVPVCVSGPLCSFSPTGEGMNTPLLLRLRDQADVWPI